MTMVSIVYALCTLVAALCAVLLLRAYGKVGQKLLLWSGLCFAGLTIANALVFFDLAVWTGGSIYTWRLSAAAISMLLLLYGLIARSD